MRKVFLDDLPRYNSGEYKGEVNWNKSIGKKVDFIYDDLKGKIAIVKVHKREGNIEFTLKYKNIEYYPISISQLTTCDLSKLIKYGTLKYYYSIGDIINNVKHGKLEIIQHIEKRTKDYNGTSKYYKYKCLICGNEDLIREESLICGSGCSVCRGQKILKGYNDLWTTHPNIAKLLVNPERGYKISFGSGEKELFKCQNCEFEKKVITANVARRGFSCDRCGKGISFPEKIMFNVLEQLNVAFEKEKKFLWAQNKRYDFYISNLNCIIEVHGSQHYVEGFKKLGNVRDLKKEQENDFIKQDLAKKNGVKHYIVIDARKSELKHIKKSIMDSKLACLFNLGNIDWENCIHINHALISPTNITKRVCDLWNKGMKSSSKIGLELEISYRTVIRHLKKGTELGWCKYDPKITSIKASKKGSVLGTKKVICINTMDIYKSITDASKKYNVAIGSITNCCKNKLKSAGKHPITSEKLRWMYEKDYIEKYGEKQLLKTK